MRGQFIKIITKNKMSEKSLEHFYFIIKYSRAN